MSTYGPSKAVDGDRGTRWATDVELSDPWIAINLQESTTINRIRVYEAMGTWIQSHSLEYWKDGDWKKIYKGDTIGSDFERTFDPVTTSRVRLNVHEAKKGPTIREILLFGPDR